MALIIDQDDIVQLVGFRIGTKLFGANILNVREILRDPSIDTIDGAPDFVQGISRIRGQVLPIIDLGRMLGVAADSKSGEKIWVLVAQAGKRNVGYVVDSVTPIIRVKTETILPTPDIILHSMRSKYINGVCETDKGLLVMVDLNRILVDDEVNAVDKVVVK